MKDQGVEQFIHLIVEINVNKLSLRKKVHEVPSSTISNGEEQEVSKGLHCGFHWPWAFLSL